MDPKYLVARVQALTTDTRHAGTMEQSVHTPADPAPKIILKIPRGFRSKTVMRR